MRHRLKNTRLNRPAAHLDHMVRNMVASLILHGTIETTQPKAKMVKSAAEKLITRSKKLDKMNLYRDLNSYLFDADAVKKVATELIVRYKDRSSGYLRTTKLGFRSGDAADMVQLSFV